MFCLIISIIFKNPLNIHYIKSYPFLLFTSNNWICPMPYGTRSSISTAKHYLLLILPSLPTTALFVMHHTLSIGALQHNSLLEQLPPRRGRLRIISFLCYQLSRACTCCLMGNVVPVPLSHLTPFCPLPLSLLSSTLPSLTLSLQISPCV